MRKHEISGARRRWIPSDMTRPPFPRSSGPSPCHRTAAGPFDQSLLSRRTPMPASASTFSPRLSLSPASPATTPAHWRVRILGRKPPRRPPAFQPLPEVVGITVHLTFAGRAYELAHWYRSRGSKVILGGLHVLSCPEEAPRMPMRSPSAMASNSGRASWPMWRPAGSSRDIWRLTRTSTAKIRRPAGRYCRAKSFLTTTSLIATRGCHNRCGFCYLATEGLRMPYRMRDRRRSPRSSRPTTSPTPYSSTTISAPTASISARYAARSTPRQNLERRRLDRCHRRSQPDPRNGPGRMHRSLRRLRVAHR